MTARETIADATLRRSDGCESLRTDVDHGREPLHTQPDSIFQYSIMLDDPHPAIFAAGAVVIALLGYARLRAGPEWFDLEADQSSFWNPLRRYVLTPLHRYTEPTPGFYTQTSVREREHVATLEMPVDAVIDCFATLSNDTLLRIEWTRQPLASIARDWTGQLEAASIAHYAGPKFGASVLPQEIVDALPEWTRKYQVHVRLFERDDGQQTAVTAHWEKAPWYPTNWVTHLIASGFDAEKGVRKTAAHLGLTDTEDTEMHPEP